MALAINSREEKSGKTLVEGETPMRSTDMIALPSPAANFQQYTQLIHSFPILDADEERSLAERLQRDNDIDAAWRLVSSHLRYVVHIARGYAGYGLPQEDLIQEGNIGLMKAVRRFDPSRGVRLLAYAAYWIRAHIHDFILRNWRIVKVTTTKAKRKLFYKLRSAKKRLDWVNQEEAQDIADRLEVSPEDVVDMEAKLYLPDESFDLPADAASDEYWAPAACLADEHFEPETLVSETELLEMASSALRTALSTLDSRSREIIERRWLADHGEKVTLQELGDRFGVSAERIRQLEANAIKRLRELLVPRLGFEGAGEALVT
jgi:RNA polymerase sigma-32 factor